MTDIVFKYGYEYQLDPIKALNEAWKEHISELHSTPRPCIDIDGEALD